MIASTRPSSEDLLSRARVLLSELDQAQTAGLVVGVGHSIGATILLAMAGAQIWLGPGEKLPIGIEPRIDRLALLAPPVGFFGAPGALEAVSVPIFLRSGENDTITPPQTHSQFAEDLGARLSVDFAIVPQAGHFSFMDTLPPGQDEPMPDAAAFRARLADDIISFAGA